MSVRVSSVIVPRSTSLAKGVCELTAQVALDVRFEVAEGTDDSRIGTSCDLVETTLEAALVVVDREGSGVIVLTDLGSVMMTVESVIDTSDEPERARFADTCLVKGVTAFSARAQLGEDLDQAADVAAALAPRADDVPAQEASRPAPAKFSGAGGGFPALSMWAQEDAVVAGPVGLHARPATAFVRLAGTFDAGVAVNGADGGSVLELMALSIAQGQSVHIEANGTDATAATTALTDMLESATEQPSLLKETV